MFIAGGVTLGNVTSPTSLTNVLQQLDTAITSKAANSALTVAQTEIDALEGALGPLITTAGSWNSSGASFTNIVGVPSSMTNLLTKFDTALSLTNTNVTTVTASAAVNTTKMTSLVTSLGTLVNSSGVFLPGGTTFTHVTAPTSIANILTQLDAAITSGGALSFFGETKNTSAPNATVPVEVFSALGSQANIDVAFVPKGTGAFVLNVPDNTATGGNKRGQGAVDLQLNRTASGQVASGTNSGILSGSANQASGNYAIVLGGISNVASGTNSLVGGVSCTAVGSGAIALGTSNVADGVGSIALGTQANARGIVGARAYANMMLTTVGDTQRVDYTLVTTSANTTPKVLTTDGSAGSAINQATVPSVTGSCVAVTGMVVGRAPSTGDSVAWTFSGLLKCVGSTVTTVGTITPVQIGVDSSLSSTALTLTADNTNKCLKIQVTGIASTNINWVADVTTVLQGN